MRSLLQRLALCMALLLAAAPAFAQSSLPEPTRGGGNDAAMWRSVKEGVRGYVSIPNQMAGQLIQPQGEAWRNFRNGPVSTWGSWGLLGAVVVLALFFAIRGRIRIERGWSGRLIERFNGLDRFVHWMTATAFVLLALSGLVVLYGRYMLLPIMGPPAFAGFTFWCKQVHNYVSFAFMLGIVLMLVLWVRHNLPTRADLVWLKKGGGFFSKHDHPPAWKFNAGQKLLFWAVILFGGFLSLSGLMLLFPFWFATLPQMQLAQLGHAIVALAMIAIILAHVYIGTIGMEGAFQAMGSGLVDENWAREHHGLWVAQMNGEPLPPDGHASAPRGAAARPA